MTEFRPGLFLDRDGVVNRETGYLYRPDQVVFTPGIFDLCRHAQAMGFVIIIITNQSGIARQLYSEADFHSLMNWMKGEFLHHNIRVDGYYFCPHHPACGVGVYRKECEDRKPRPGMILRASIDHKIDLKHSVLVGDRCSDIQAGAAANVPNLILLRGTEPAGCAEEPAHSVVSGLHDIIPLLMPPQVPA